MSFLNFLNYLIIILNIVFVYVSVNNIFFEKKIQNLSTLKFFFMSSLKVSLFFLSSIGYFLIADFIYIDWFALPNYFVDPYVYWGTGEVFSYVKFHFSETYYFRRWTINFVNYLFSSIFDPYYAIYFKNSFLLVINLFLSILLIFRLTKSFFLSLVFLTLFIPIHYYFYSIGMNYNQATGIFFINLIIFITFFFNIKYQYKYFFFIGFVIFLAIVTYQFLIVVIMPIIIFWYFINYKFFLLLNFKNFFLIILLILTGIFAGVILEYLISFFLNIKWQNLFIYSYKVRLSIVESGAFAPSNNFFYQIFLNKSFFVSAVSISSTLFVVSIFNKNKNYLAFASFLLCLSAVYLFLFFLKSNALFNIQTNIYLFIYCLFGLILILDFIIKNYEIPFKIFLISFIFFLSLVVKKYINFNDFNLYVNISILILFFLILFFYKTKLIKWLLIIFFIILYVQLINNSSNLSLHSSYKSREDIKIKLSKLSAEIRHATKQAIDFNPSKPRRLWIFDTRPHQGWSSTISSLYGNYSAINLGYRNNAVVCDQITWILSFPNSVLVTYGFDTETNSLNKLTDLFKPCGSFVFKKSIKIENAHTFIVKKIN
jgi:hypothetical protein